MILQRIGQKGGLRGIMMRYRERLIRTRTDLVDALAGTLPVWSY